MSTFAALVRAHHAAVYRSARRITGNEVDAADVTQQVFVRVLEGRLELPDGEDAARVLRWWAVRTALTQRRAAKRRRRREDRHAMDRSEAPSPEHSLGTEEEKVRLWSLIESLPADLRVPLVLRFHEEMSYSKIGAALAIAENTAHDRVRKALAFLRSRLVGAGLAAIAASLEGRIAAAQPASAPAKLAEQLARLSPRAAISSLSWSIGVGAVVAALTLGALQVWPDPIEAPSSASLEAASGADVEVAVGRQEPAASPGTSRAMPAPSRSAARAGSEMRHRQDAGGSAASSQPTLPTPSGWVEGRILFGHEPVAGARVAVSSIERQGKIARFGAEGACDADGRFRVQVEVDPESGGHYQVLATHADLATWRSESRPVRVGETTDFGNVEVLAAPEERVGFFVLEVEVVAPSGAPLSDARVRLERVRSEEQEVRPRGRAWWTDERLELELEATTDQYGTARLEGRWLGRKRVTVDPAGDDLATVSRRLAISEEGAHRLPVRLKAPEAIAGRALAIDGTVPTGSLSLVDSERRIWRHETLRPDGSFRIGGLSAGDWELIVKADGYSKAIETVRAGDLDLDIRLKEESDVRDVGSHAAEIHGRIVRASDGEPLPVADWFAVDCERFEVGAEVDVERDLLPNLLFPMPVQRAYFDDPPRTDRFHLTGLSAGRYIVRLEIAGAAMWVTRPIELGEDEIRTGVVLEAHAPAKVSGVVRDENGRLLDEALVFVTGVGPHSDAVIRWGDEVNRQADGRGFVLVNASERRARDGRYELDRLPPMMSFRLVAVHPDHEPVVSPPFRLEAGEERELDLELEERRDGAGRR